MRRLLIAFVLLTAMAWAQNYTPKVELGLGYSYSYMRVPNSSSRANMNGVLVDATTNLNRWFGLKAEFGTHYHCISGCWSPWGDRTTPDQRNDSLSFMVGPRLVANRDGRLSPWVHLLGGVSNVRYSDIYGKHISATGGGLAIGGGLDFPLSTVTVRFPQVDYLRMPLPDGGSNNVRVGGGVIIRLGHRKDRH